MYSSSQGWQLCRFLVILAASACSYRGNSRLQLIYGSEV